jgi:hypothetical protein
MTNSPAHAPGRQWILIEPLGYTPAAAKMSAMLGAHILTLPVETPEQEEIHAFGQGNEREVPGGELAQNLVAQTKQNFIYNTRSGGPDAWHEAASQYLKNMFNIKADSKNAFLLAVQGRTMLKFAMNAAQVRHDEKVNGSGKPYIVTQKIRWGLVDDIAKWSNLKVFSYDQDQFTPSEGFKCAAQQLGAENIAAFLSFAAPDNPFSYRVPVSEQRKTKRAVDKLNADSANSIMFITDAPYAYSCPVVKESGTIFIKTGVDETFDPQSITPEIYIQTFSKFLGTAEHGGGVMAVSDNILPMVSKQMLIEGQGITYHTNLQNNIAHALTMKEELLGHAGHLRGKYDFNGAAVETRFKGNPHGIIVAPGEGVMRILRAPGNILGRKVDCFDGQAREIKDGYGLMEYMANEFNTVVVYNDKDAQGNVLLRLALAEPNRKKIIRDVDALYAGLDSVLSAPQV